MRSLLLKRFLGASFSRSSRATSPFAAASTPTSSLPFSFSPTRNAVSAPTVGKEAETSVFPRECQEISYDLNWALAAKGVIVKDKASRNLEPSELEQKGAGPAESLSGLPIHLRGNVLEGADVSKTQFGELLKQVTDHISSIPNIFVHDGAVGSSSKCDAKVRVISDCPSAVLSLLKLLWRTPAAVSQDSYPLTVYVATSISASAGDAIGLKAEGDNGFIAASLEHSSLILCGRAFSDANGTKDALAALSGPIISAQGGLPLSARLLSSDDSVVLLFAPEELIPCCSEMLVSADEGVILLSDGVAPFFQTGDFDAPNLFKLPATMILATSDSSEAIPFLSKLTPGQAAYYFLAGYQGDNFVPAYNKSLSFVDQLELATALRAKLEDHQISSFLVNIVGGENRMTGLVRLVKSTLSKIIPPFEAKGDFQRKVKRFLSEKYQKLPKELSF